MDKSNPAVDRVRPILQAMERSIDAARQRRTHESRPEPSPVIGKDAEETAIDAEPPRQRARPKRSTPIANPGANPGDRTPLRPTDD